MRMMLHQFVPGLLLVSVMAGAQTAAPPPRTLPVAATKAAGSNTTLSSPPPGAPRTPSGAAAPQIPAVHSKMTSPAQPVPLPKSAAFKKSGKGSASVPVREVLPAEKRSDKTNTPGQPAGAPRVISAEGNKHLTGSARRDPFVSIIQNHTVNLPDCAGKKCLAVGQIVLKGVVKGPNGMLAMVENSHRKLYFLRENDPIFNGEVLRITDDAVIFRETVLDQLGRQQSREIVKRIGAPHPAA